MSVYVDEIRTYRTGRWCHMTADTEPELHVMAARIGLKRAWFQDTSIPHYDLRPSKRELAVQHGAREETWRESGQRIMRQRRSENQEVSL